MPETRPTGDQIRFVSANTGEQILDAYLEAAERGGRSLGDLMADLFGTDGSFNEDLFQFRVNQTTGAYQIRYGTFVDPEAGWVSLTNTYFFRALGTYATGVNYERTDVVFYNGDGYICVNRHLSSTAAPDGVNFMRFVTATVGGTTFVSRAGDTMTGTLALPSNGLIAGTNQLVVSGGNVGIGTATPGSKLDVVGNANIAGRITGLTDPTSAQDAATKNYVDNLVSGLTIKASVKAASTAAVTTTGPQTVDGIALIAGDRVLLKDQGAPALNGIYVVAAGAWTRATDADTSTELKAGTFVFVEQGTINADTGWVLTTDSPITLGTTALNWAQFTGAGTISAGTGLSKVGSTISLANTAVTPNTYGSSGVVATFTVDAQGRITGAANVAISINPATQISGTILDGNLSSNVPLKNAANTFTADLSIINAGTGGNQNSILNLGASSGSPSLGDNADSRIILNGETAGTRRAASILNTGSNLQIIGSAGMALQLFPAGGGAAGVVEVRDGSSVRVLDSTGADSLTLTHNGTNAVLNSVGGPYLVQTEGSTRLTFDATAAAFTVPVSTNGVLSTSGGQVLITSASAQAFIDLRPGGTSFATIAYTPQTSGFRIYDNTAGVERYSISQAGNHAFSNDVTVTDGVLRVTDTNGAALFRLTPFTGFAAQISYDGTTAGFKLRDEVASIDRLSIDSAGLWSINSPTVAVVPSALNASAALLLQANGTGASRLDFAGTGLEVREAGTVRMSLVAGGGQSAINTDLRTGSGASANNHLALNYTAGSGVATIGPQSNGGVTELNFQTTIAGPATATRAKIDSLGNFRILRDSTKLAFDNTAGTEVAFLQYNTGVSGFIIDSDGSFTVRTGNNDRLGITATGTFNVVQAASGNTISVSGATLTDTAAAFRAIDTTNSVELVMTPRDGDVYVGARSNHTMLLVSNNASRLEIRSDRVFIPNAIPLTLGDSGGANGVLLTTSTNHAILRNANSGAADIQFQTGGANIRAAIDSAGVFTYGGIEIGYRGLPNVATAGGTASTADRGKMYVATGAITFPTGLAAGDTFSVYNNTAANLTLTQGAGLTLRLAGTALTGDRTVAQRGLVTVTYISSTEAIATGAGIS